MLYTSDEHYKYLGPRCLFTYNQASIKIVEFARESSVSESEEEFVNPLPTEHFPKIGTSTNTWVVSKVLRISNKLFHPIFSHWSGSLSSSSDDATYKNPNSTTGSVVIVKFGPTNWGFRFLSVVSRHHPPTFSLGKVTVFDNFLQFQALHSVHVFLVSNGSDLLLFVAVSS